MNICFVNQDGTQQLPGTIGHGSIPVGTEPPSPWHVWDFEHQDWKFPLDDIKAAKRDEMRDKADALMSKIGIEYGAFERQTWDQQSQEAHSLQDDPDAPAPLLRTIAQARGITPAEMAERVLRNEFAWKRISGLVIGTRLRLQDAIDAATLPETLAAIEWPEQDLLQIIAAAQAA